MAVWRNIKYEETHTHTHTHRNQEINILKCCVRILILMSESRIYIAQNSLISTKEIEMLC